MLDPYYDDGDYEILEELEHIPYVKIQHETDLAWKLLLKDGHPIERKSEWFPKSQCTLDEDELEILVPPWLAIEKGLV